MQKLQGNVDENVGENCIQANFIQHAHSEPGSKCVLVTIKKYCGSLQTEFEALFHPKYLIRT